MIEKFNPNNVKALNSKFKIAIVELECQFLGKFITFTREDFNTLFGLEYQGMEVCKSNAPNSVDLSLSQ